MIEIIMDFDFPFTVAPRTSQVDENDFKQAIMQFASKLGAPTGKEAEWVIEYLKKTTPNATTMRVHMLAKSGERFPDYWRVGDIVEYVDTDEYGYKQVGEQARIMEIPKDNANLPASKCGWFYTTPVKSLYKDFAPILYTTPSDVIFISRGSAE
jgi:hypothetical protein